MTKITLATATPTEYEIVWGHLARIRYSGIPAEARRAVGAVPVATMLWAAIAQKPNPFPTWEHLAEHITTENFEHLSNQLGEILPVEPDAEKKNTSVAGLLPDSASA